MINPKNSNIVIFGLPRCGSTVFLKLLEQAIEQHDTVVFSLKELFTTVDEQQLDTRMLFFQDITRNSVQSSIVKLFVSDITRYPKCNQILEDQQNFIFHLTRKNKYNSLISYLRMLTTSNSFGDFNKVDSELYFDFIKYTDSINDYVNIIQKERMYTRPYMHTVYYEDFEQDPIGTISKYIEVKSPLIVPMKKQITNYDNVFVNQQEIDNFLLDKFNISKEQLRNYVY